MEKSRAFLLAREYNYYVFKNLTSRNAYVLYHIVICLAAFILLVGLFVMLHMGQKTKEDLKNSLLVRAQNAALFVDPDAIRLMQGNESDTLLPEYIELKRKLTALREINPDVRFIYIMGYNGTNLFFYVDSEDPTSEDYSPPGQEYPEASAEELIGYFSNDSYVIGPVSDRWGTWVSAMAPIIDSTTGTRVGVVGVDLSADDYEGQLIFVRGAIIAIAILIASLILVFGLYIRKSMQHMYALSQKNEKLETTKGELEKIQKLVQLGKWRWTPKSAFVSFDDTMHELTGVPKDKKVTYPYFQSILLPEDRTVLDDALAKANAEGVDDFTVVYHVTRQTDNALVTIKSACTIERSGSDGVTAVTGTAQELECSV